MYSTNIKTMSKLADILKLRDQHRANSKYDSYAILKPIHKENFQQYKQSFNIIFIFIFIFFFILLLSIIYK